MTTAHCPHCRSGLYTPDPSNGGAGRNKCLECGQASPTAHWYAVPVADGARRLTDAEVDARNRERGFSPFYDANVAAAITRDSQRILNKAMETDTIRKSSLSIDRPFKPAAPIRQYKDDDE